jgi:hypothetical protein
VNTDVDIGEGKPLISPVQKGRQSTEKYEVEVDEPRTNILEEENENQCVWQKHDDLPPVLSPKSTEGCSKVLVDSGSEDFSTSLIYDLHERVVIETRSESEREVGGAGPVAPISGDVDPLLTENPEQKTAERSETDGAAASVNVNQNNPAEVTNVLSGANDLDPVDV